MASIFPNNNLPVSAQPWGREVQKRVQVLEDSVSANQTNNTARDKQLATSIARLDKTVTDLTLTKDLISGSSTALNDTIILLDNTITQINNAEQSASMILNYAGVDGARTASPVARVTFTRPSWANRCTVIANGTVASKTTNQATEPVSGTMTVNIDGTLAQYANSLTDPTLSGTTANKDISTVTTNQTTTAHLSFARSFNTVTSTVTVETLVTKTAGTAATTYSAEIAAQIYWSKS